MSARAAPFHPRRVAVARSGMIATAHWRASEVGARMFAEGGNAIDAAVAAAFALGVCEPAASGLGGQTLMMIRSAAQRRTLALDGSSRAPHRPPPAELPEDERLRGHRATTVPSTPAALGYALESFGRLPLARVLEGAIALADGGVAVTELQHRLTVRERSHLRAGTAGRLFLGPGGKALAVGAILRQPVLARTLRRIAEHGWRDFYQGGIARDIAADMARNGGLIQADDLAQIPMPIERRPVATNFAGLRVFAFPPLAGGRTLIAILDILGQSSARRRDPDTPDGAALLAGAIRRANLDRRDRPFDPSFHPQVEERRLLSEDHAKRVARELRAQLASKGETTHLSAMDAEGNVVALTQSIERVYGSFAASPELGFLYNNYMNAFELDDSAHRYYLRSNGAVRRRSRRDRAGRRRGRRRDLRSRRVRATMAIERKRAAVLAALTEFCVAMTWMEDE